ncbi:MAG: hypothetical protein H6708_10435 [Kofleriaceae bacterium]|nr:hypothetical protein [Kofleriaceae bacterium]
MWDGGATSLRTVPAHATAIAALAIARDGDAVLAFSAAGRVVRVHRLGGAAGDADELPEAPSPINALAAAGPDRLIAAGADGLVRPWQRGQGWGEPVQRHDGAALAVALAGDQVVSGGVDTLVRVGPATWRGHAWDVHAVAAAAGVVVSAARDGAVAVWRGGTPHLLGGRHAGAPAALALAPDGAIVASASRDDAVVIWRVADAVELARWTADAPPTALAMVDARTVAVGDAAGEVAILALPDVELPGLALPGLELPG